MSSAMPSVPGRTGSWVVMVTIASVIEHTRSSSAVIFAKRGFVGDGHQGDPLTCDDPLLLNASGWFYAYNKPNPYRASGLAGDCAGAIAHGRLDERFVAMDWCLSGMAVPTPPYVNQTYFMGYNEPNNLHNCNKDAETAAKAWSTVMANHPHSKLVSPATAGNGIPWFDQFFGNCSKLYGASGCNISYLAAHDYSCNPDSTMSYLQTLHERYGYKIWLTEFSCGDNANAKPTKDHLKFMQEILPRLDAADFVFRYSWMSSRDPSGRRALVETVNGRTQLTELGQVWNS